MSQFYAKMARSTRSTSPSKSRSPNITGMPGRSYAPMSTILTGGAGKYGKPVSGAAGTSTKRGLPSRS